MFFSKTALVAMWWKISLAVVVTKDAGDCAAFPDDQASLGEHAMLQVSMPSTPKAVLDMRNKLSSSEAPQVSSSLVSNDEDTEEEETSESSRGSQYTGASEQTVEKDDITSNEVSSKEDQKIFHSLETGVPADATQNTTLNAVVQEEEMAMSNSGSKYEHTEEETEEQNHMASTVESQKEQQNVSQSSEAAPNAEQSLASSPVQSTVADATQNTTLNAKVQEEEMTMSNSGSKYDHTEEEMEEQTYTASTVESQKEQQNVSQSSETPPNAEQSLASSPVQSTVADAEACDWQCYLARYPDLQKIVGADNVAAAEEHWNSQGQTEGRDCTCPAGESFVAEEDMTQGATVTSLDAKMHAVDIMTSCEPWTEATQEALQVELKSYEQSEKFQEKMSEASGESPATAGHVAIMKYLREKVLQPGFSVLDLGCAAGGMLRLVRDEYDIGWAGVPYADPVPHDSLVGVELVPGWVNFAQKNLKNISIFEGDITDYSLPEPYASKKFDLVLLNDVMGSVEKTRYGCFLSQLDRATRAGSIVYMHAPAPTGLLADEKQGFEKVNAVPHHFIMMGMATIGFELVSFEHDMDTVCGGEGENLPKQLEGAHCYYNGMPKYTHNVFRKVYNAQVMDLS